MKMFWKIIKVIIKFIFLLMLGLIITYASVLISIPGMGVTSDVFCPFTRGLPLAIDFVDPRFLCDGVQEIVSRLLFMFLDTIFWAIFIYFVLCGIKKFLSRNTKR